MNRVINRRRAASIGVGAVAVLAIALPAGSGASFATHFSVVSEDQRGHETENGFVFRTFLFNPANLNNRVGSSKARCVFIERSRKARCKVLFHFDGSIGGFGDLLVKGNNGRGDHTMNVVDGSGDFSGAVTGKMFIHNLGQPVNQIDFALTR